MNMDVTLTLTLWQIIMLAVSFFSLLAGFGKILAGNFKEHIDQRFAAAATVHDHFNEQWRTLHNHSMNELNRLTGEHDRLDRELANLRVLMVEEYIKRQDVERVVERLFERLDNLGRELHARGAAA